MCKVRLAIVAVVIGLGGCVTLPSVNQLQTECEAKTKTFPEMTECLKSAVANEKEKADSQNLAARMANKSSVSMLNNPTALKLYLLKLEQLSQRVQKHEISELDARVELQQLYVEMENQRLQRQAAAAAANAANRQRTTTCHDNGYGVSCTTD